MYVTIKDFKKDKKRDIQDAACLEWEFSDWNEYSGQMSACGQSNLCGGETDDEFAHRLAKAVMEANGGPCGVEVNATYMEDLPHETYTFDKADYKSLVGKKKGKKK